MNEIECNRFEKCEATLCPLDGGIKDRKWYAEDEICRARLFQRLLWIRKQKKMVKLGLSPDIGYFTVEMLNAIKRVTRGIKGADPDKPQSYQSWFKQRDAG